MNETKKLIEIAIEEAKPYGICKLSQALDRALETLDKPVKKVQSKK